MLVFPRKIIPLCSVYYISMCNHIRTEQPRGLKLRTLGFHQSLLPALQRKACLQEKNKEEEKENDKEHC